MNGQSNNGTGVMQSIHANERVAALDHFKAYTQNTPIIGLVLFGFYLLVYVLRYLYWRHRRKRYHVRLLEYEKLRWLWHQQDDKEEKKYHERHRHRRPSSMATLTEDPRDARKFYPSLSSTDGDDDEIKEERDLGVQDPFVRRDSNLLTVSKFNSDKLDSSTTSSSSAVTLASPGFPSDPAWSAHHLFDEEKALPGYATPSSSSMRSLHSPVLSLPVPVTRPGHESRQKLGRSPSPPSSSSSSSSSSLPTSTFGRPPRSVDSWQWYDTKAKRQRMVWQWSVAMGRCQYAHARNLTAVIERWERT
ncbi:hypothetical protein DM01DRAFT_324740 [Hesseltinella vesiculosa]|uniref:Uncharacterized protein n=1 Tax=Hesseltinella vesiculosa TaxID=101127 RepID=A0A1X2GSL1_9FUNG|nr:hypothetical protein DM01DRAFT_324740 [Hesseltinella vesiculosa]